MKAVTIEPNENGLTVIGGKNGEGKTSILDSIAWALGGEKRRPTNAQREGSVLPPEIRITMNNGLIVERKGKNSTLYVTDPTGAKAGQRLLDSFVEELALDIPKFLKQNDKEKAETLLKILGIDEQLSELDRAEKSLCAQRVVIGRAAQKAAAHAESLAEYPDAGYEYIDPADLIQKQQEIITNNANNARLRLNYERLSAEESELINEIREKQERLGIVQKDLRDIQSELECAIDEPTDEIEEQISNFAEINRRVRANNDKKKAEAEALAAETEYAAMTKEIEACRDERKALLDGAQLPLEGLNVEDGILTYKNRAWDCMSASEQMIVATAIVRKLKPQCGFVLLDKLEQLDSDTLNAFGKWLTNEQLQVIATRVTANKDDCTIIIEDGKVLSENTKTELKKWKAGE